jgi:hypothetical protein
MDLRTRQGTPPPTEGCLVRFVSFQTDAARVDENIAFFKLRC